MEEEGEVGLLVRRDGAEDGPSPRVTMRGHVLAVSEDRFVVSCGGLLVGGELSRADFLRENAPVRVDLAPLSRLAPPTLLA